MKRIIKKVIQNNSNQQLLVTIPKHTHLKVHDYVELVKVPKPIKNDKGEYVWDSEKTIKIIPKTATKEVSEKVTKQNETVTKED